MEQKQVHADFAKKSKRLSHSEMKEDLKWVEKLLNNCFENFAKE